MGTASPAAAMDRPHLTHSLFRAVDRPAREVLELSHRPLMATLAPALLGIFLIAAASAAAGTVFPDRLRLMPRLDVLRAVFEAFLVVVPGTVILATYLRLRLPLRTLLAATAIGLLGAGLVATCLLPLMAFLVLLSREAPGIRVLPALLVPGIALGTVASLVLRVITSLDRSRGALWFARAFAFFLVTVFLLRVHAAILDFFSIAR